MAETRDISHLVTVPPNRDIISRAKQILLSHSVNTDTVGRLLSQDPVAMLELCKLASSSAISRSDTSMLPSAGQVITLIGVQATVSLLNEISEYGKDVTAPVAAAVEKARRKCFQLAGVARLLANVVDPQLVEQGLILGLFVRFGDMLAPVALGERYIPFASLEINRAKFVYRISKEFNFDLERSATRYLSKHGLPDKMLVCLDRDSQPTSPDLVAKKLIVMGASELLVAFEDSKLEKYAPERTLPAKSYFRRMQLPAPAYARMYGEVSSFLSAPPAEVELPTEEATSGEGSADSAIKVNMSAPSAATEHPATLLAHSEAVPAQSDFEDMRPPEDPALTAARVSISFLGRLDRSVISTIRGIRNAISLFGADKADSLRSVIERILARTGDRQEFFTGPLIAAASNYYPKVPQNGGSLTYAVRNLTAEEVMAVVAITSLRDSLKRRCEPSQWPHLEFMLRRHVEIARIVALHFRPMDPGVLMLLAGMRVLSLGIFLFHDYSGFAAYMRHLKESGRVFDTEFEVKRWEKDHFSTARLLTLSYGFETMRGAVFTALRHPEKQAKEPIRQLSTRMRLIQAIDETESGYGNQGCVKELGIVTNEARPLQDAYDLMKLMKSNCPWLA